MTLRALLLSALLVLSTACATTTPVAGVGDARTAIGRADELRLTVRLASDHLAPSQIVNLFYELENLRSVPIAFAELVPEVSYDKAAHTITVTLGTEVPGNEMVPRLTRIAPGEKKSFSTGARMPFAQTAVVDPGRQPRYMQISAHVLGDVRPFTVLIDIPERAIYSPRLADELFVAWIEHNETLVTNAIPIEWNASRATPSAPAFPPMRRRRS